jgi:hypothetical protein
MWVSTTPIMCTSQITIHLTLLRLVLAVVGMHNLAQLLEARAPLQRNVSVQQLLPGLDVAGGVYLELVLIKMAHHVSVGGALLAGIVKGRAATSHAPRLLHIGRKTKTAGEGESWSVMRRCDNIVTANGDLPHDGAGL